MGLYEVVFRQTLYPLLLMIITPNVAVVLPYIIINRNSNLQMILRNENMIEVVQNAWNLVKWRSFQYPIIIVVLLLWAGFSCVGLGGEPYLGPKQMSGFRAEYFHSGFRFYVISMTLVVPLIAYFDMLPLYNNFVTFAAYLVVFGFLFSIFLYIKGKVAPSPGIFRSSGNPIFDFYWGTELYPRVGEFLDLKQIIICRFGLFLWQLIILVAWKANFELYQASYARGYINWAFTANVLLQSLYLAKFYYWEDGYMSTIDIAFDHFGYYTAWGCIAFVPTFYTSPSLYLVRHSPITGFHIIKFLTTTMIGVSMLILNYITDYQRQVVRKTDGKCEIWGKPAKIIRAVYHDEDNKPVQSLLLASGFWSCARHMNYAFEIGLAFVWSATASFISPIPYFYVIFLTILLVHRSLRDDHKCRLKYGKYWEEYCQLVPYRIFPFVF
ncbi:7-dehydrocholesterol reductase-like protein [Dinothrombium tinctorium]|uniref:7-dehydrocholesterol reductase n=1 Tax=Dinothrombium tinctorium TaxID=1965070 RepID=A0A443R4E5_9ACAR|nr:7-dehydrocholesterol reductase-like protein [Dinothrombium tinctorium]